MKLLEIKNVKKSFGAVDVLHDISLSVEQGEVVAIIGPSGSGKSTLLRCATLLETMDEGELVYLGEHAVSTGADGKSQYVGNAELKKIQGYFGLVFQNFNLFPHYSVLKNLMDAPVHVQKRNKEEVKKEAMELLEKMGLSDKADCYPCQLSGGQQQRVAIARALVNNPKIILADEPTGALDSRSGIQVMNLFQQLNEEGVTIIMITHDANIANHAKKVLHIFDGEIVEDKERKEKQQAEVQSEKEAKNDTVFSEIEQDFGVKEWEGEI